MTELLRLDGLCVSEPATGRRLLDDIKITVKIDRTLALVGESGSGKSLLAKAILGLLPENLRQTGDIFWHGRKLSAFHHLRGGQIGLIVQNAMSAFNPLMRMQHQLLETLQAHKKLDKRAALALAEQTLTQVQLTPPQPFLRAYPNQLSGGQLQRIMLALTLALAPELIIADEPTTALDSLTQHQLLPLFQHIRRQNRSLIFITHDIALARLLADDIAVLQHGRLIEWQPTNALFQAPQQPYTRYLLAMRDKLNGRFRQVMQGAGYAVAGE